jgi:hypothetical protein
MVEPMLSEAERAQLRAILDCREDELEARLAPYAAAAKEEYLRMILGQRVFTRGQDVREYRLYLLVRWVFQDTLPSEQQISALFQTTTTQSRALLRAVMSKYQYELQSAIGATLRAVLDGAQQDPDSQRWRITVDSENVIEALNRRLAAADGTLPQVVRAANTITTYELANSSYLVLRAQP